MFEAILNPQASPPSRFGTSAALSISLHAGVVGLILWVSAGARQVHSQNDVAVKFINPAGVVLPPPPPGPAVASSIRPARQREHRPVRKVEPTLQARAVPDNKPPEGEPGYRLETTTPADLRGESGGVVGGVAGGTVGGIPGGGAQLATTVLPFGEGMTRPEQTSGELPKYTREALAAHVEGNMLAKCVITSTGKLENCRIIKALPHMEQAVLDALSTWRYKPVRYQGRPVAVDYLIQIRLVIPH